MIKINAALPIILIFLIALVILIIFYFFFLGEKCKKLDLRRARKLEVTGYFLLFIVLFWELIFKEILNRNFYNIELFYIQEKLDIVFNTILDDKERISNFDLVKYFHSLKKDNFLETQLLMIDIIEVILKILSTIFIAIGRIYELYNKKIKNTAIVHHIKRQ